jgi:Tat protein translocase TatB subunit
LRDSRASVKQTKELKPQSKLGGSFPHPAWDVGLRWLLLLVCQATGYNLRTWNGFFKTDGFERYFESVVLLILESLGSTELLFILVMALVFFGPRKLPQLSRTLGKNLAEFRKASEDFKRTWEKEVNLEELADTGVATGNATLSENNSILQNEKGVLPLQPPTIAAVTPAEVIARHATATGDSSSDDKNVLPSGLADFDGGTEEAKPSPKHDWL